MCVCEAKKIKNNSSEMLRRPTLGADNEPGRTYALAQLRHGKNLLRAAGWSANVSFSAGKIDASRGSPSPANPVIFPFVRGHRQGGRSRKHHVTNRVTSLATTAVETSGHTWEWWRSWQSADNRYLSAITACIVFPYVYVSSVRILKTCFRIGWFRKFFNFEISLRSL